MFKSHSRALAATIVAVLAIALVPGAAHAASAPVPASGAVATAAATPTEGADDGQELSSGALAEAVEQLRTNAAERPPLQDGRMLARDVLRVEVAFTDDAAAQAAVAAAGGTGVSPIVDGLLAADVPIDALAALEADPAIRYLRLPSDLTAPVAESRATSAVGLPALTGPLVPMAGLSGRDIMAQVRVSTWHTRGYRGSGVSVGIIDYFNASVWNTSRAAGEVPNYSGTFCRVGGDVCSLFTMPQPTGNHGVAVAEAVHDIAPDAKIYLATVATNEDLRAAIDYFASKGVKIISRSLGAGYDGSGRGDGPLDDLASYAVSKGISWFNSAGNPGVIRDTGRIGAYWRGTWNDPDGDGLHEFVQPNGSLDEVAWFWERDCSEAYFFGLRWNDETGGATDYDLLWVDRNGDVMEDASSPHDRQTMGAPAIEKAATVCPPGVAGVKIRKNDEGDGSAGDVLEMMTYWYFQGIASNPYSAGQPISDSADPGVASIGAVDPVGGRTIASYSAQGPTNDERIKPDFSAGSNFSSRAYANWGGRFNGTSAATPIAAGAAALVLQRKPGLSPAALMSNLKEFHLGERGSPGPDNVYGGGELVLDQLFTSRPAPSIAGTVKEGQVLTARTGAWAPTPSSFSYQWFREATPIAGATSSSYRLTAADAGKRIRVRATPARLNFLPESTVSPYTAKVVGLPTFTTVPTPKLTGTPSAGSVLTASVGTWSPKPTLYRYEWRRDGAVIAGATSRFYRLTAEDAGTQITVTVIGSRTGYRTASKPSNAISVTE